MQPVDFLVSIELIDALHAFHVDQSAVLVTQIFQPVIKLLATEEKTAVNDIGVCQFIAQTIVVNPFPVIEIIQVIRQGFTFRRHDFAIVETQIAPKNPEFLQIVEVRLGDCPVNSFTHQDQVERFGRYRFVDPALVDQPLDDQVVINLTLDDAGLVQFHETVDNHFRCSKQSFGKCSRSTDPLDHVAEFLDNAEVLQQFLVNLVLLVAQYQRIHQRIADGADADLKLAAVSNQRA